MPTKTKKRPTKKAAMKKRKVGGTKKLLKKAVKKAVKKVKKAKGKARKAKMKAKPRARSVVREPKISILGKVIHFYDRIHVAIVELGQPVAVGHMITFKRGEFVHTQPIVSMQINRVAIQSAKKKDVVGIQVSRPVPVGAEVMPV
jgi:hypothetical protein